MPRKLVLVTGATGFLGQHIVEQLRSRNWEVVGTSYSGSQGTRRCDLMDGQAVRNLLASVRPTHLIHAAWLPVRGAVMQSKENLKWLAVSLDLVQAFHDCGGTRALVVGSSAEYDWAEGICRNGVTPMRPATIYGAAKLSLNIALTAYARHTGLELIWPRVFFLYGPGEDDGRLVASVIRALLRGLPAECSEGRQVRDYLYVGDVASGLVLALESHYCGSLDLASGTGIAVRDLVSEVANRLGRPDLIRLGALPSKDDYPLVIGDPKEAESLLQWTPTTSLAAGLDKTIFWGREKFARSSA